MRAWKWTLRLAAMASLAVFVPVGCNMYFKAEALALAKQYALPHESTNGLKHALAAAELYRVLYNPNRADEVAEFVYWLGEWNERVEYFGRPAHRRDSPREMAKDLYNNAAGVMAARVMLATSRAFAGGSREMLGEMAKSGAVAFTPNDKRLPILKNASSPDAPIAWFRHKRRTIEEALTAEAQAAMETLVHRHGLSPEAMHHGRNISAESP
jgi:hypothetical protein